jgi:Phage tail assembly chaperone protein
MKLYISQTDGVWDTPEYRDDFVTMPKEVYNAKGWYDLEPTPAPETEINVIKTHEIYLDTENIVRYRWTQTLKTGDALADATREKWSRTRFTRNELLKDSDYTQLSDLVITPEIKSAWITYRQALRDITTQTDAFNLVWPISPEGRVSQIGVVRV